MLHIDSATRRRCRAIFEVEPTDRVRGVPPGENPVMHEGPMGRGLSLFMLLHPDAGLNISTVAGPVVDLGAGRGTVSALVKAINPNSQSHAIEIVPQRIAALHTYCENMTEISLQCFDVWHNSFLEPEGCTPLEQSSRIPTQFLFNNAQSHFLNSGVQYQLQCNVLRHCAPGSVLVCFDRMLNDQPLWDERGYLIGVPGSQLPWAREYGDPDKIHDLIIYKYTKTVRLQFREGQRRPRNIEYEEVSYTEFAAQHNLHHIIR